MGGVTSPAIVSFASVRNGSDPSVTVFGAQYGDHCNRFGSSTWSFWIGDGPGRSRRNQDRTI